MNKKTLIYKEWLPIKYYRIVFQSNNFISYVIYKLENRLLHMDILVYTDALLIVPKLFTLKSSPSIFSIFEGTHFLAQAGSTTQWDPIP